MNRVMTVNICVVCRQRNAEKCEQFLQFGGVPAHKHAQHTTYTDPISIRQSV